jgi:CubicO group peptidase (beta-lactamase class C family)
MRSIDVHRRELFVGGAGALAFTAFPAFAKKARIAPVPTSDWANVQAMLSGYVADGKIPGGAGAVARGADEPRFCAAGLGGREGTRTVDADSLFRIYSMTKPITAIAAMMLIEDGKIGLDQDVGDFIPGFKKPRVAIDPAKSLDARPASGPLTIRHLMTHSGGLGYIITSKGALQAEYAKLGLIGALVSRKELPGLPKVTPAPSLAAFAERIATLPLMYEPNSTWSYSAGLDVLGRVIELASGMPFETFLQTRLFGPLGMASTWFVVPQSELPRMTTNYGIAGPFKAPIDEGATTVYADPNPLPLGGGGLVSSPRDYDRFLRMLAGYGAIGTVRVMKEATAKLALSNLLAASVSTKGTLIEGQGFGAGGRITLKPAQGVGAGVGAGIGTFGWGGAAATIAWVDPTRQVRGCGFAQFMPDQSMPFTRDFGKAVYAGL